MNLKYVKTLVEPTEKLNRISAACWSPNNARLALVSGSDFVVSLYDDSGVRQDKFTSKPLDPKTGKYYIVKAMAFSPDSSKLALAQSDGVVFVYKLGLKWGEKKTICNKFLVSSTITSLVWPSAHQNDLVFGAADGKVRIGNLRANKCSIAYSTESYVISLCCSPDGNSILSGHVDGVVYIFHLNASAGQTTRSRFVQHSSVPQALAWGESIVVAGTDSKIVFYDQEGLVLSKFDYSNGDEREYTCAACSPSGQSVVVGGFNKFRVFSYSMNRSEWEEAQIPEMQGLYTVTSLAWKRDGSRLVVGNICGGVEIYDACIKRYRYRGKYEMTYVSPSQVIVKRISTGHRIVLSSMFPFEITKVNVYQDQFIVGHTPETIIVGDMSSNLISEIQWAGSGNERFIFDTPKVCMIYNAGELTLIEYGNGEPLGSCRTEHVSGHLLSVRLAERPLAGYGADSKAHNKKIAYLVDPLTIRVDDLVTSVTLATIPHDSRIDWLELNSRGTKLLFRDRRRVLNLFDVATQTLATLLSYCGYVQWVPESDVVVAQSRNNLCVWYSIDAQERVSMFPIKGDVVDIERSEGRTEVVVDEGINTAYLSLNESLIAFGTAVEDHNYDMAVKILEDIPQSPETDAMWASLATLALQETQLRIAERCYAALGDVCKARYLHKVNKIATFAAEHMGSNENGDVSTNMNDGTSHYLVRAKLAMLSKRFSEAEACFLEQGQVEAAMEMYRDLLKWDESIAVAEARGHPDALSLKRNYMKWLVDMGQEEQAAQRKEKEGEILEAIELYLRGGLPAKASNLINHYPQLRPPNELLERIASALTQASLHEKAGILYEKLDMSDKALESFRKGHAYRQAVELCRSVAPTKVQVLEEEWADWLVQQGQLDSAINHYIEAGKYDHAVEVAMESKQWAKVVQIVDGLEPENAKKYLVRIARHYEESLNFDAAERYYVKGGVPQEAVEMYTKNNLWEAAHVIAVTYMTKTEITALYVTQAQRMVASGRLKEAEKLYLTVNEPDKAINMYKEAKQYDHMVRLVGTYHREFLQDTHHHLAQQLESEGQLKQAEKHYVSASKWQTAVEMYRAHDMWDEAMRLANKMGGQQASNQVAIFWARTLGGDSGVNLLVKLTLIDQAIDIAIELEMFRQAEDIARQYSKKRLVEVYLKHAEFLEDTGKFADAESMYIKAEEPKEAIKMYLHQLDWLNATRVAESFEPSALFEVYEVQARAALVEKDYQKAEIFFIKARKPDAAVAMYKELKQWADALRVTKEHMAHRMQDVSDELLRNRDLSTAELLAQNGAYSRAIDAYLKFSKEDISDVEQLTTHWEQAVKLANDFVRERLEEVTVIVARKLLDVRKNEKAGALFESVGMYKEAIDVYVQAELWEQARRVASQKAPQFSDVVSHNKLSYFAQRGDWENCLEAAKLVSPEMVSKYAGLFAQSLLEQRQFIKAIQAFTAHGANEIPLPANIIVYRSLIREVVNVTTLSPPEEISEADKAVIELKEMLSELVQALKKTPTATSAIIQEFERFQFMIHLIVQRITSAKLDMPDVRAKASVALLRFTGELPSDKAFLQAGMACRDVGWDNMALVLLNRYLDISDAIEEGDASMLDNSELENTDLPMDVPLPTQQFLDEESREEVRNWILATSVDSSVAQELRTRSCDQCNEEIYEASLKCTKCNNECQPCIITGYPIKGGSGQRVSCKNCGKSAIKEEWNKWLVKAKRCSWCGDTKQTPVFN